MSRSTPAARAASIRLRVPTRRMRAFLLAKDPTSSGSSGRSVSSWITTVGRTSSSSRRRPVASKTSHTRADAPRPRTRSAPAADRATPVTSEPIATRRRVTRRPSTPLAPATRMRAAAGVRPTIRCALGRSRTLPEVRRPRAVPRASTDPRANIRGAPGRSTVRRPPRWASIPHGGAGPRPAPHGGPAGSSAPVVVRPRQEATLPASIRARNRHLAGRGPLDAAREQADELDPPERVDVVSDGDREAATCAVLVDPRERLVGVHPRQRGDALGRDRDRVVRHGPHRRAFVGLEIVEGREQHPGALVQLDPGEDVVAGHGPARADPLGDRMPRVHRVELRLAPRPRPQAGRHAELRAAHDVVLLGIAPVVLLRGGSVEPDHPLGAVVHEAQQRGVGLAAEADGLLVVAVAALEDDQHDVVLVDDLGAEAAGVLDHPDPEASRVLEHRRQPLVVLAEAAELVVVLPAHVARQDEDVQRLAHRTASACSVSRAAAARAPRTAIATLISVGFMVVAVGMSAFPPTTRLSKPQTRESGAAT